MYNSLLLIACSACLCTSRRVQFSIKELESRTPLTSDADPSSQSLAEQDESTAASASASITNESPTLSPDVERVLTMFCLIGIGYLLRKRFPGNEGDAIQKLLLQFLVPATLFRGMSKEKLDVSHLGYLISGVLLTVARAFSSWLASCAAVGRSCPPNLAKLQRTAVFQISTLASALSVLPFISEFVGPEFVGLGGMVDLPMKFYNLIIMPSLLKLFNGGPPSSSGEHKDGQPFAAIIQLLKDPITMSLILGMVTAIVTNCQGLTALGTVGSAIGALADAQTPVLFLLIGVKLNFQSSTPLICVVLLLATQGILLIMVHVLLHVLHPGEHLTKFIIVFSQGAPSLLGLGVISSAVNSGLHGYSPDFAFDLVGMAFPISSVLQCLFGLVGASYAHVAGVVGFALLAIAGLLRIVFSSFFQEPSAQTNKEQNVMGA